MANNTTLKVDLGENSKLKTAKLEDISVWIVEDRDNDDNVFETKEDDNTAKPGSSADQVEFVFHSKGSKLEKERKIGHRRVGVGGEVTYKRIQTSQIMGSIQLGIQHTVGGLVSKPERDILMQDFLTVEIISFNPKGSNNTPAHPYQEFVFKTYGPNAFRYFRDLFGIRPDDFLVSFCSSVLRELSNPGASGSIFYMTADDKFILKTIQHKEGKFLQKLLPGYYMNLNQNPRTLLPKFFGLYCYQCKTKNIRMVAMNNLLPSSVALHQKYDLKGSTYKRKASKSERQKKLPTYKDLDFMEHHSEGIFLDAEIYNSLFKTIQRDCRVLESFQIMDYSLLIGVHNLDEAEKDKFGKEHTRKKTDSGDDSDDDKSEKSSLTGSVVHQRLSYVASSGSKHPSIEDDLLPGGIPAKNAKGERLILFIGIIDILQSYHLKKKLEHAWKSIIQDGDTVSVVRPNFYSQRFQDFMSKKVFKKSAPTPKNSPPRRRTTVNCP